MRVDAVLIAGPTASGKSAAALAVAERFGGTVVNADSMQVYAELHVVSARPGAADEARAPHLLYGHVRAAERYSAGRYAADVARILRDTRLPIFTGGTGLYFEALTAGLSPVPPVPAEVRARVRARFQEMGMDAFYGDLARRDPETAATLRKSDTQRVLRAADVWEATGRSLRAWQRTNGTPVLSGLHLARFVLAPPRDVLAARIGARFLMMMEAGALDEVRALTGLDPSLPAARALGVRPLQQHLAGMVTLDEAIAKAQGETRRYAKRQMTWFRNRMAEWTRIEEDPVRNIIAHLSNEMS